jgi:WD40 repeat protein
MARLWRGRGSAIILVVLSLGIAGNPFVLAQGLYESPFLIVDPGMHTGTIGQAAVDAAGRFIASGSDDKTVRIWSVSDGRLLQTIRVPAGPGHVGKVYAVAMSPDGNVMAAGGWMEGPPNSPIYLFDTRTGKMTARIGEHLPEVANHLVFSADGRYLAATLGGTAGLRVFDRDKKWSEAFRDTDYARTSYGAAFAADGRLATSSVDGKIRLYNRSFSLVAPPQQAPSGHPRDIAFSPDGNVLALGYFDNFVDLLDGHSLARLPPPSTTDLQTGNLYIVAWSTDGQTLFAGGRYIDETLKPPVLAWDQAGLGKRRALSTGGTNSVSSLVSLPLGQLLVATADPCLTVLEPNGSSGWTHCRLVAEFRGQDKNFSLSADGTIVDFGFEEFGKSPLRFDLRSLTLSDNRPIDDRTRPPKQDGLSIEDWENSVHPKLNGKTIGLATLEMSRSLAIHPDGQRFILGTSGLLRSFDTEGKVLWNRAVPGDVYAVNITRDGRLAVSANDDGTIRWFRMDEGRELLVLQVLGDKKNWVAWTPEGFYAATPGAYGVLRWGVDHGVDAAAETVPVSAIARLNRPDVLPLVLQELETVRALGIADLVAARRDVRLATGTAKAPGARLHLLTIGISDYGEKAKHLHLQFADKDANDVSIALVNTKVANSIRCRPECGWN